MTVHHDGRPCDDYWPLINDEVEGVLDADARLRLSRHLEGCPACAEAAADLALVTRTARALPPRHPRADAWQRIAAELATQLPQPAAPRPATRPSWRVVLAAAAMIAVAVASTVWLVRQPAPAPQQAATPAPAPAPTPAVAAAVNPSSADSVKRIDDELKAAERHYESAIAGLEQIAKSDQAQLDPALAATLQKNMGVIDQAIRDSRQALQSQPASQLAQDSLFEALQRKVSLLEDTIALINVMRKGDQAGTARIVQGTNKS